MGSASGRNHQMVSQSTAVPRERKKERKAGRSMMYSWPVLSAPISPATYSSSCSRVDDEKDARGHLQALAAKMVEELEYLKRPSPSPVNSTPIHMNNVSLACMYARLRPHESRRYTTLHDDDVDLYAENLALVAGL